MSILDGLQNISNDKRHYLSKEQNFWIRSYKFGSQSSFHIFHGPFHRDSPVQFQVLNLLDCHRYLCFRQIPWRKKNCHTFSRNVFSVCPFPVYFLDAAL